MNNYRPLFPVLFFLLSWTVCPASAGEGLPADVLKLLNRYNVVWDTPSTTGSMESMPLGNGDLTANVWVEQDGDLMLYLGKSDTWSEATRLLKVGRVRIHLSPNPFAGGAPFKQELNLHKGEINITAGAKGRTVRLRLWIDANQPVVRVEAASDRPLTVRCTAERMRPQAQTFVGGEQHLQGSSFRGLFGSPVPPSESADVVASHDDRLVWYHRNESSFYPTMLERQNAASLVGKYPDPYLHRTFGAAIEGDGMTLQSDTVLLSAPARRHALDICALTAQTPTAGEWLSRLDSLSAAVRPASRTSAYRQHAAWWNRFWNRSYIFLSGDEEATRLTRAYLLQRYLMACQSRGAYPTKFNGGTLTFDYQSHDGDYRQWGPGYWYQNCRLYYWPLAASGDLDLKKPWFDMYLDMLPLQTDITRLYYGHGGAFFPETLNFFGMYIQDDWGWDNPGTAPQTRWIRYHYEGALEMLAELLDAYRYTLDESFARRYVVPFATQVIRFFACHFPRINRQLRFIPANSLEQFWDCLNPIDYIAGLRYDIALLKQLPASLLTPDLLAEWDGCLSALPPLPMEAAERRLLPAEEYGQGRNFENPECYAIFPFRLYGLGRPDLEVGLNTYRQRTFRQATCWSQDPIQAALLGLADDAREGILKKVAAIDPAVRFPAFWKPGSDYTPDLDNGGAMAMALQLMLLQDVGDRILLLPALPDGWNVRFKLHAHDRTVVEAVREAGQLTRLSVWPEERRKAIETAH